MYHLHPILGEIETESRAWLKILHTSLLAMSSSTTIITIILRCEIVQLLHSTNCDIRGNLQSERDLHLEITVASSLGAVICSSGWHPTTKLSITNHSRCSSAHALQLMPLAKCFQSFKAFVKSRWLQGKRDPQPMLQSHSHAYTTKHQVERGNLRHNHQWVFNTISASHLPNLNCNLGYKLS